MNLIAYDAAYLLYPESTFEYWETLVVNLSGGFTKAMEKYKARGWTVGGCLP